jgi:hypothetical protein
MVISGDDARFGLAQARSLPHGSGHCLRRVQRKAGNGRARAAQESTERARLLPCSDHPIEKRNELCSKRLMKMIAQDAAEILVAATGEGGRDGAGIAARFDCKSPIDLVRQCSPRLRRFHLEVRNEEDEAQPRIDREFLMPIGAGNDESPELGRSGVVRMTLELGTELENLRARQRAIEQRIQGVEHTEPNRDAAPEATGARHIALDFAGKCKRRALRRPKEFPGRLLRHPARRNRLRRRDSDEVVEAQGRAETIKAGAEIRSSGRDACYDLLLFQRKSPENTDWRAEAVLILPRLVPAARRWQKSQ